MHPVYIALATYYAIPAISLTILHWWETDLIMGSLSAYWQERFDLRHIVASIVVGAVWPILAVRLAWSAYLRWPRGRELVEEIQRLKTENSQLRALSAPPANEERE